MLRKTFIFCVVLFLASGYAMAQLPYAKMLDLSDSELKEKKFKYDSKKNRYSMSKKNKTNQTMNIMSAVGGSTADIKPHKEDYNIQIQKGADNQTAYFTIVFHDDEAYHKIATWMAENNIEPIVTNSGKLSIEKFSSDSYAIELITELIEVKSVTGKTIAAAKSVDESYNVYTYTIYTGIEPQSEWHTKEAEKKAKKKLKGDKEDVMDLM